MLKKKLLGGCIIIFILVFCFLSVSGADVVYLKNGARYEGKIVEENSDELTVELAIGKLTINKDDIISTTIEAEANITPEEELSLTQKLTKKAAQITSYKCQSITNLYDGSTVTGELYFSAPDRLRAEYEVNSNKQSLMDIDNFEVEVVADGKTVWVYYPKLSTVYKKTELDTSTLGLSSKMLSPETFLEKLSRSSYKIVGEDNIDGYKSYCFETSAEDIKATLDAGGVNPLEICRLWFREKDGFLVKTVGYTADYKNIIFINFNRDIIINPGLSESVFKFRPPDDALVVSQENIIQEAKEYIKEKGL